MGLRSESEALLLSQNFETERSVKTIEANILKRFDRPPEQPTQTAQLAAERTFNENQIQGDLDLDANLSPMLKRDNTNAFVDNRGRPVSVSGYLIDREGNIVNQEGVKVFNKEDLREGVDLPVLLSLERFNFNPLDILGNVDEIALG